MRWFVLAFVALGIPIGAVRLHPNFPAHAASPLGSYEAAAHFWATACIAGPLVFWFLKYQCLPRSYSVAPVFARYDALAHLAFWSSLVLTLGVEGPLFFLQIPYPWHQ